MKIVIVAWGAQNLKDVIAHGSHWEYWGLNVCPRWAQNIKWTRWFNLHHYASLKQNMPNALAQEIGWAHVNDRIPYYVLESWGNKLPNERIFPRQKLEKMPRGSYHCGSIDWMLAYAILIGAKEVAVHGASLAMEGGEPLSAWPCLEYWIGYAQGKGIKISTYDCGLFFNYRIVRDHRRYGYDEYDLIQEVK